MPDPLNINYLMCEGDSITEDQYAEDDEGVITSIVAQNEYRDEGKSLLISSEGFPGSTTADILARTPATILEYEDLVNVVLLQTGTNDILLEPFGGTYSAAADAAGDYDGLRADLTSIITAYTNAGFTVIPVAFPCRQPDIGSPLYTDNTGQWLENVYNPLYVAEIPDWCFDGKPLVNLYEESKTFSATIGVDFIDVTHFTTAGTAKLRAVTRSIIAPLLTTVSDSYAPVMVNANSSYIGTDFNISADMVANNEFEIEYHIRRTVEATRNLVNANNVLVFGSVASGSNFGRIAGGGNQGWGSGNGHIAQQDLRILQRFENGATQPDVNITTYTNGKLTAEVVRARGTSAVDAALNFGESGVAGSYFDGIIYGAKVRNITTDTVVFEQDMVAPTAATLPVGSGVTLTYNNLTASDNVQVVTPRLTLVSAPVISTVSNLNAESTVTVTVDGYQAGATVNLNGIPQLTTEATATTLTIVMPRGGFGGIGASIAVTVTDSIGTSNTINQNYLAPVDSSAVTLTSIGPGSTAEEQGWAIGDIPVYHTADSQANPFSFDAAGYAIFDAASTAGAIGTYYVQDASDGYSAPAGDSQVINSLFVLSDTAISSAISLSPVITFEAALSVSADIVRSEASALISSVIFSEILEVGADVSSGRANSLSPTISFGSTLNVNADAAISESIAFDPQIQLGGGIVVSAEAARSVSISLDPVVSIPLSVDANVVRSESSALIASITYGQILRIERFTIKYKDTTTTF